MTLFNLMTMSLGFHYSFNPLHLDINYETLFDIFYFEASSYSGLTTLSLSFSGELGFTVSESACQHAVRRPNVDWCYMKKAKINAREKSGCTYVLGARISSH